MYNLSILTSINLMVVALPFEDSMIIFTIAVVTVVSGLMGFLTKYKIFAFFSIGGYLTLAIEFQDYPLIVTSLVGVIFYSAWYGIYGK